MADRQLTDSELIDADLAKMIITAPVWIAYFLALIVAGALNEPRDRRRRG